MGVSGRALGIGVTLERPVGPDRRNDVWAVAGTGKSSLVIWALAATGKSSGK